MLKRETYCADNIYPDNNNDYDYDNNNKNRTENCGLIPLLQQDEAVGYALIFICFLFSHSCVCLLLLQIVGSQSINWIKVKPTIKRPSLLFYFNEYLKFSMFFSLIPFFFTESHS